MAFSHFSSFWAGLMIVVLAGCATVPEPAAPESNASRREVLDAAVTLERSQPGRRAASGAGDSMAPIYGENTVIVSHPIAFEDLESGMIVAFISQEKGRVIHQLTRKTRFGWRSQGLNNVAEDAGYVTAENLIGVVYGVFQSSGE